MHSSILCEVVGVDADIRHKEADRGAAPQYYLPYAQAVITNPYLTVRTAGDPVALQGALREIDKSVPVYQVSTLEVECLGLLPLYRRMFSRDPAGMGMFARSTRFARLAPVSHFSCMPTKLILDVCD